MITDHELAEYFSFNEPDVNDILFSREQAQIHNLHDEKAEKNKIDDLRIIIQELKQEAPVTRSIKKWSDEADAKLQDCFVITDWNMFRDSSDGIEEYTISVIGFINKCIDDVVLTVTVRTYPNQKP